MITVNDILSRPLFKNFALVSGECGLCNHVQSAGFFEWETGPAIMQSFPKGEFVITTLSAAKDDPSAAEEALASLFQCKIAAIAIKNVYFRQLPDSICTLSNKSNIPILFFDSLYVDDVLFDLKTAILENDPQYQRKMIDKLLANSSGTPDALRELALQLNPAFEPYLIFSAFVSEDPGNQQEQSSEEPLKPTDGRSSHRIHLEDYQYTLVPYKNGMLCICTARGPVAFTKTQARRFLALCFQSAVSYQMGISLQNGGLETISQAIQEAIYANISCRINQEVCLEFRETGVDRLLCYAAGSTWSHRYYTDLSERLVSSGDAPDLLLNTLITYVKYGGSIVLTSKHMYQHSNTIRYRISKIQSLWGTRHNLDFDAQAQLFVRLHFLYQLI